MRSFANTPDLLVQPAKSGTALQRRPRTQSGIALNYSKKSALNFLIQKRPKPHRGSIPQRISGLSRQFTTECPPSPLAFLPLRLARVRNEHQ